MDQEQEDVSKNTILIPNDDIPYPFMINDYETSIDILNGCKDFDLLQIEVEDDLILNGDPHVDNLNDGHVKDNIASFYYRNNL